MEKKKRVFKAFTVLFFVPPRALVSAHTVTDNGDITVADTKEVLKLHLWQLLQRSTIPRTKEWHLKLLIENVQQVNQLLHRIVVAFRLSVMSHVKYCILNRRLVL